MARVVIVGAGIGGLAAAILLGRDGHRVVVCERDRAPAPADPDAMWSAWPRPGTPHARLGHTFLAGARRLLAQRLPDVLEAVVAAGAQQWDIAAAMPGDERRPEDADLVSIMARRPLVEGLLRLAAEATPTVELRAGRTVTGLAATPAAAGGAPRVRGVTVRDEAVIEADVVVLAGGRSLAVGRWLEAIGARPPLEQREACGFVCYTRYFRVRGRSDDGVTTRLTFVRDPPYAHAEMIGADRGTFATELILPTADTAFRPLRRTESWMAAARAVPEWREWLDAERSAPITPGVDVMGQEHNMLRRFVRGGRPVALGVHAIGDARCQTDSLFAWGCGNALLSAAAVADVVARHPTDPEAQALALEERVDPELAGRFAHARARDRAWHAVARGEPGPPRDRGAGLIDGLLHPAAARDPDVYRAVMRWELQLDPASALAGNRRIAERARDAMRDAVPASGDTRFPSRDALLAAMSSVPDRSSPPLHSAG